MPKLRDIAAAVCEIYGLSVVRKAESPYVLGYVRLEGWKKAPWQ